MATLDLSKYVGLAGNKSVIGYSTGSGGVSDNGYSLFVENGAYDKDNAVAKITSDRNVTLLDKDSAKVKEVTELNVGSSTDAWNIVGGYESNSHVKTIKTGAGDDTVEMLAVDDSATISTGAGKDTVSVATALGSMTIELGDGADSLTLNTAQGALTVNAGSGANEVSIGKVDSTFSYTGGDDKDIVSLGSVTKSAEIRLGNGANDVSVGTASSDLTIESGDGNDSIKVTTVEGNGIINAGDGNNFITVTTAKGNLTVTAGSGKDSISIGAVEKDATISLGDGADSLKIAGNVDGALTINADGDAANYVEIASSKLDKTVSINMGSGNDSVFINNGIAGATVSGSINLGDGKDSLRVMNAEKFTVSGGSGDKNAYFGVVTDGVINLGSGKDTVDVYKLTDSTIDLGDGRDELSFTSVVSGSVINLGADNDQVYVADAVKETTINLGDGNDTISVGAGAMTGATISGGAGKDVFSLGSGFTGDVTIADFEVGTDTLYAGLTMADVTVNDGTFNSEGYVSVGSGKVYVNSQNGYYAVTTVVDGDAYNVAWAGENATMIDATSFSKPAVIVGNNNDDTSDTLLGGAKADTINAGANDYVYGGAGNDSIWLDTSDIKGETAYVGFTKNGGKDTVSGFGEKDVVYLFENSISDISKITTAGGITLKMGTATLNVGSATTKFGIRDNSGKDYTLQVVDGTTGSGVSSVDDMADIYYAADSSSTKGKLNFSGVNDKLVVDLGNTGRYTNTNNAQYLGKFDSVKGGSDDTILMGAADQTEILEAGTGATTIWGGGSKSDVMVHNGTDNSVMFVFGEGDGKDSVSSSNWGAKETSDVLWLSSGAISSVKNNGTDTTIALTSGDKLTLNKATDVNVAIKYTTDAGATVKMAKIGKSGQANTFTYSADVTSYTGGSGNTMSVGSDVDTAQIWLDGSRNGVSYVGFKTVDAHTSAGDIVIAGVGDANESLVASRGTSSLWGGAGTSNDTLVGTTGGTTTYYFGNGDGKDVITGSHSDDLVNLYNVAESDIAADGIKTTSTSMEITLKDGSSLTINNMSSSSVKTFQLSDGSKWEYSTSTKNWTPAN